MLITSHLCNDCGHCHKLDRNRVAGDCHKASCTCNTYQSPKGSTVSTSIDPYSNEDRHPDMPPVALDALRVMAEKLMAFLPGMEIIHLETVLPTGITVDVTLTLPGPFDIAPSPDKELPF